MSRANFVQVQLAAAATDIQTTLSIKAPVGGFKLPPADGGRLVLTDSPGRPTAFEVISYTSRTGSGPYTLGGVTRGLEGTVGLVWGADAYVLQSLTVGEYEADLAAKVDKVAGQSLMTDAERTKLGGIAAGAQVNTVNSVAGRTGDVVLAKADVGLGNVDNTSDANKPISTAAQTALNAKAPLASPVFTGLPKAPTPATSDNSTLLATTAFVKAVVAALVDSSPAALDTLNELAAALGDDPNFATTMTNALAGKLSLSGGRITGNLTVDTGIDGGYGAGNGGSVDWGACMWGMGPSYDGVGVNTAYLPTNHYGISWLRASHGSADTQIGEGVYVYQAGVLKGGIGSSGIKTAGVFYGNGAGITSLNASNLSAGTVPDACLSGTYTGFNITGNAATATKLATPRTLSLTGDVTGSTTFDGTANVSIAATVANDSHTHSTGTITGLGTAATKNITISTAAPSGGADGDLWVQY
jgi:hypothetical protein